VRLPIVAVLGFFLFNELPSVWTWVGAAIMIASTFWSTRRDAQISKAQKAAS
jgi:drug/metabolite transporter (DMT)-like permease